MDTLGLVITCRVEPAGISDQKAGARLLGGPRPFFPLIRTVMADAGHRSRKLARALKQHEGWALVITKRGQRAFKIKGLTWSSSAASPGSGATGGRARTTSAGCRRPRP